MRISSLVLPSLNGRQAHTALPESLDRLVERVRRVADRSADIIGGRRLDTPGTRSIHAVSNRLGPRAVAQALCRLNDVGDDCTGSGQPPCPAPREHEVPGNVSLNQHGVKDIID